MDISAIEAASTGRRIGVKALRWEFNVTRNQGDFKVNNSYTSSIARELIRRNPALEDLIELREQKNF